MEDVKEHKKKNSEVALIRHMAEFKRYESELRGACQRDFEKVLLEFDAKGNLFFSTFSKIWRESNLNLIFAGLVHTDDIGKFTEICMYVALKLFVYPKNQGTKVGAFYLLYALYHRQPFKGFIKIRITYRIYNMLMDLVKQMKEQKQYDFLYIYGKLRLDRAFHFVATATPISISPNLLNMQDVTPDTYPCEKGKVSENVAKVVEESLEDIRKLHQDYVTAMKQFTDQFPEHNITCFDSNFIEDIQNLLQTTNNQVQQPSSSTTVANDDDQVGKRKLAIKRKAFKMKNKSHMEVLTTKSKKLASTRASDNVQDDDDLI